MSFVSMPSSKKALCICGDKLHILESTSICMSEHWLNE
jgi:hypothetical protein